MNEPRECGSDEHTRTHTHTHILTHTLTHTHTHTYTHTHTHTHTDTHTDTHAHTHIHAHTHTHTHTHTLVYLQSGDLCASPDVPLDSPASQAPPLHCSSVSRWSARTLVMRCLCL